MTSWLGDFVLEKGCCETRASCPGELAFFSVGMRHTGVGRGTGAWGLWWLGGKSPVSPVGMEGGVPRSAGWATRLENSRVWQKSDRMR